MGIYEKVTTNVGSKFLGCTPEAGISFDTAGFTTTPKVLLWNPVSLYGYVIIRNINLYILDGTPIQNVFFLGAGYSATEPVGTTVPNVTSIDGDVNQSRLKIDTTVATAPVLIRPVIGLDANGVYKSRIGLEESNILKPGFYFSLHVNVAMPAVKFVLSLSFEEAEV